MSKEKERLLEHGQKKAHWRRWGPYLSERQWGTVREDYSEEGDVWNHFPERQAKSRAYRWGEDGIAGISDNHQKLCFACSFWNEKDEILKERLFGLSGPEGNHGEDVKEYYFYLENTPTHSYMRYLYKYPHKAYPYKQMVEENQKRGLHDKEYELEDTNIFEGSAYFDIFIEYAKASAEDILIKVTATNRGKEKASLHVLPTLWYRNTWSWNKKSKRPSLKLQNASIEAFDGKERYFLHFEKADEVLFTENDSNLKALYNVANTSPYVKDAFHTYLIEGVKEAVNPLQKGTKAAVHYAFHLDPGASKSVILSLSKEASFSSAEEIFSKRRQEAEEFYDSVLNASLSKEMRAIQRQALYGMLWNKQFYHYVIEDWLKGDAIPINRKMPRNADWVHIYNDDILSVPDKWEYPAFFSWDSAFQALPLAMIDPEFAKKQLSLLTREWYMHPNGQLPAYEWSFNDVNPPVHAWAAWRVFKIEKKLYGKEDLLFLEAVFQKLLLNFTWWVNRKDAKGKNIFQGGFLGLDNISIFDRSVDFALGSILYQSDATSWMGMYCCNMLSIACHLSKTNPAYEDMASKFYEHFLFIAEAINGGKEKLSLWNEEDGFYYDLLSLSDGKEFSLKVRSMVGIIPLFAVAVLDAEVLDRMKDFRKRITWFLDNREDLCAKVASMRKPGLNGRMLLSILNEEKLRKLLKIVLDEKEFLSPYGIRSLSKYHEEHPFSLAFDGKEYCIDYEPAESTSRLFGGNSNWRGPVWFPLNILIIESLQKFHHYFGDDFKVECPTGSGNFLTLWDVAGNIAHRLIKIFKETPDLNRPFYGSNPLFSKDPYFKDLFLFNEYFQAETGLGLGASHQTGWSGLIAKLIEQYGDQE